MKKIKRIFHGVVFLATAFLYYLSYPLAFILYGRKKYWLISEIDFDARDNGYHFFKYINENHKEINSIYVISKRNRYYKFVNDIGETVEPFSYKHMLVFIAAKAKLSTLVHGCSPSWYITKILLKNHGTGKNIALKHGIFKNLHPNYFKKNAHLDLICCGAKQEFEFVDNEFGYEKGVARYTGLARFDALHNLKTEKTILIMPTWRRWLDNIEDENDFISSDYYIKWKQLLNNKELRELIKQNNISIHFYVHPKLNKYLKYFNQEDYVEYFNSTNGDSIQEQLKNSSVLITDFSSVFFDFAYMRKPTIYYQFDEDEFNKTHYKKAYFDYRENGFGPVCVCDSDVIRYIDNIINNNMNIEKVYLERIEEFFPLFDNLNCERIFNAVVEVLK